jgi:dimethylargininase
MERFAQAVCRRPGPDLADGLTTAGLGAPDHARALAQFDAYVTALRSLGLAVTVLDALPGFPDAHFVEDTAVMIPDAAVIARPGHPDRDGEQEPMAAVLEVRRPLERITAPGTLDGGDVLQVGSHFLIRISDRTNEEGARQLGALVESRGCAWAAVPVDEGLHFKSSVNALDDRTLLVTAEFLERPELADFDKILVPAGEEYAANALLINGTILLPAGYPRTRGLLAERGLPIHELDTSEFRKMDGGLTCLSLRW